MPHHAGLLELWEEIKVWYQKIFGKFYSDDSYLINALDKWLWRI
jgi:hypothetical protein